MDPEHRDRIRRIAEEVFSQNPGASISKLNRLLSERAEAYDNTPQPEMAGLSPRQVNMLLYGGSGEEDAGLVMHGELGLQDVSSSRMLVNARLLLASIRDQGSVKATVNGNLNRAFVVDFARSMSIEPLWDSQPERLGKSLKEEDIPELNILRHVLQMVGFLRKTKGRFYVTRKGTLYTAEDRAGELFANLFFTVFHKLNLAVLTPYLPEFPALQDTVNFSFYAISTLGDDWHVTDETYERLVLPFARESIKPDKYSDPLRSMVRGWLLRPLEWLGMVQIEEAVWTGMQKTKPERIRKTPLFDQFLSFHLAQPPPASRSRQPVRMQRHRGGKRPL